MAWLTGWTYRKSHVIDAATGAGTNYQIGIKIYKTTGTDGTEVVNGVTMGKVYVGTKCRDDFGDIRFTDDDGTTVLDCWLDPSLLVSGTSAVFWFKEADSLESVNQTIYVYYGKSDATTTSNGTNTFEFFDDLSSSSGWTLSSKSAIAGGNLTITPDGNVNVQFGYKTWTPITDYRLCYKYIGTTNNAQIGFFLRCKNTPTENQDPSWMNNNTHILEYDRYYANLNFWLVTVGGISSSQIPISEDSSPHFVTLTKAGSVYTLKRDSATPVTTTDATEETGSKIVFYTTITVTSGSAILDWIFVSKYVSPEPAHGAWGSEEIYTITYTKTYDVDTLFKKLPKTKTNEIDMLFQKMGITKPYDIDVLCRRADTPWIFYDVDTKFKGLTTIQTNSIDTIFIQKLSTTDFIDVMLKKTLIPNNPTDVLFQKTGLTETMGIDTTLLSLVPPVPPAYAQPTLLLSNPNGQLWCYPISWREIQDCVPAIRPIPLASSEYLDSDTYVLKPRTIEAKFRLSDMEKDTFESMYNYASTSGANLFTNIYLLYNRIDTHHRYEPSVPLYIWHYVAWFSNKDYTFEYSYQDGRYVRWWTLSLIINVENLWGSSAVEPDNTNDQDNRIPNAVTLDNHQLVRILDFARADKHPPMIPNWINQDIGNANTHLVESYLWNECVLDLSYIDRMTNDEKYLMDKTLQNHQKVNLTDYVHNIIGNVWVSRFEATFDPVNWEKPWKTIIEIKANNSEINFQTTANINAQSWGINSNGIHTGPDNLGTMYLDEEETALSLPATSITRDIGVHIFYFFLPSEAIRFPRQYSDGTFSLDWNVSGDAILMDVHTFDGESIAYVLVYGDCTVIAKYVILTPQCPTASLIITDPTFASGFTYWIPDDNVVIDGGVPSVFEFIDDFVTNGSFANGWTGWTHSPQAILRTDVGFDDNFSVQLNMSGAWISQTITPQINPEGKAPWMGIFFAQGSGVVRATTTYSDDSTETWDIAIVADSCGGVWQIWGGEHCMPYNFPNWLGIVKNIKFEWVSGDFLIDTFFLQLEITYGYIEQSTLAFSVPPACLDNYDLHLQWKGYYNGGCCGGSYAGYIDVLFEYDGGSTITTISYHSSGTVQDDYIHLSDYLTGVTLTGIKIFMYGADPVRCYVAEMVNH